MGKTYESIEPRIEEFIRRQPLFFVATAPLSREGLVNLSPKGLDTLAILDPHTVAYLDLVGSGIETVAHLHENGRIVFMFCAFEGPPLIVRLHGRGEVLEPGQPEFEELRPSFPSFESDRAIIRVRVERVSDSCGYGVPLLRYEGERSQLTDWAERKGPEGLKRYRDEHNARSLDGLPGLGEG
jgi:hypothetical protein